MTARFPRPLLYVVADLDYVSDERRWLTLVKEVGEAAAQKPVALQVRAKGVTAAQMTDGLARRARKQVRPDVPLLLNGPEALADRLGYDGVHWTEAAIPGRSEGATRRIRFASVHSVEAVHRAERADAEAVVFGPVFAPGSKPGNPAGLEALAAITRSTTLPVLAIGGITAQRVAPCLAAGARGVAVVSGVLGASSPRRAVEQYVDALQHALQQPDLLERSRR